MLDDCVYCKSWRPTGFDGLAQSNKMTAKRPRTMREGTLRPVEVRKKPGRLKYKRCLAPEATQ